MHYEKRRVTVVDVGSVWMFDITMDHTVGTFAYTVHAVLLYIFSRWRVDSHELR
jgi:hypothetical protein